MMVLYRRSLGFVVLADPGRRGCVSAEEEGDVGGGFGVLGV